MKDIIVLNHCLCPDTTGSCECPPVCVLTMKKTKKQVFFDIDDYDLVDAHNWTVDKYGYCVTTTKTKREYLHNILMPNNTNNPDLSVDHKNINPADNRRQNLRLATRSQQIINQHVRIDNTSGFKGVSKKNGNWRARWYVGSGKNNRRERYFNIKKYGSDELAKQAAIAYNDFKRSTEPFYNQ
jgi:hypothetical protein